MHRIEGGRIAARQPQRGSALKSDNSLPKAKSGLLTASLSFRSASMLTFEFRVRMPHGGEQKIVVRANNRRNAEAMAEAQTGGKVLGGRQLAS